jgi:hypothetical protein
MGVSFSSKLLRRAFQLLALASNVGTRVAVAQKVSPMPFGAVSVGAYDTIAQFNSVVVTNATTEPLSGGDFMAEKVEEGDRSPVSSRTARVVVENL